MWPTRKGNIMMLKVKRKDVAVLAVAMVLLTSAVLIFGSSDSCNAQSWVGIGLGSVRAVAIDPNNSNIIYAGTSFDGTFKSTNGGSTWTQSGPSSEAITIDRNNSSILYAGTMGGGVYKSTNGGGTWSAVNSGLPTHAAVRALAIDPTNSNIVYAGEMSRGVFKSTDGGTSWYATNSGLTAYGDNVHIITIDPRDPTTVYVGSEDGVFKSTNGGNTWSLSPFTINNGITIAIDPINSNITYAGGTGVLKSVDAGNTWSPVNSGLTNMNVFSLTVDPYDSNIIYAGTYGGGVFKSIDGGNTWSAINSGLTNLVVNANAMAIDPNNSSIIYVGTNGGGVFKTQGVPQSTFRDVSFGHWAYDFVMALYNAGITGGCSSNPPQFCPDATITRAQLAVFMETSLGRAPAATCAGTFSDVNADTVGDLVCRFIEDFAAAGITGGCGGGRFCPNDPVTRAQMAVFIEAALGRSPAASCTGRFGDVNAGTVGDIFCRFIEDFADQGITGGCSTSPPMFCPNDPVTRAQMAVFLVAAPDPLLP
jgi:photosystem II stability/assembly factor-like uncharacterized protein